MLQQTLLRTDSFLSEELLRLALASSGVSVWQMDPDTGIIDFTADSRRMFGLSLDQPVDYTLFLSVLHPDDRAETDRLVTSAFDPNGSGEYQTEYRVVHPDGEIRWIMARGRAFFAGEGGARKAVQFIGTVRDVTERKDAEAALQAALERQEVLLKEVNHRVKNSLQLVSSLLRLQARRIGDVGLKHQLEDAMTRISAIAHIHERLYRDNDVKRIDFGAFIGELCADLQGTAPKCTVAIDAPHIRVPTDRAIPLALVANELVTNAFKYAYPDGGGGPVSIAVNRIEPGEIAIRVSDSGVGLPAGFSVADASSLGMVLIDNLLHQLDGSIELVASPIGTNFLVTAPIEAVV